MTIKMVAVRTFRGANGFYQRNEIFEVGTQLGQIYESKGLARQIKPQRPQYTKPIQPQTTKTEIPFEPEKIEHSGGGWFVITQTGEKIRGKENAIQRVKELEG